jgi:phospholipase/carboxylesterase
MDFKTTESTDFVVVAPTVQTATASVVWLHGLGADGHDFAAVVPELPLPDGLAIRFVFPHARVRPVTINNGYVMRAWYDIKMTALQGDEDETGIRESESLVRGYIQREREAGIAANRIVVAGFSQGGAVALHTGLRYPQSLAGVLALSTYLPLRQTVSSELSQANRAVPILMCHGTQDSVVPLSLGALSRDVLSKAGCAVEWKQYPIAHQVSIPEIIDIGAWLRKVLP